MSYIAILVSSLLFLSILCVTCHVQEQTFLKCMSNHSKPSYKILQHVYTSKTLTYIALLEFASQNPRWFNSTAERPFLIVLPRKETDIWPVISCSKKLQFQIRVKSGGHDYEGLSFRSKTPFIMIDISNLNSIDINLKEETAWIQTGVTLGQLYYEIDKKSKTHAFPGGLFPNVGSGGHISGGGLGTLLRKYGMAADNVLDARIMDVNGKILDRKAMGEDLFWAIRGGGGASFGVILSWKLKLVRVPREVTAFAVRRKLEPGNLHLLQKWQKIAPKLPEDLFIRILVQNVGTNAPGDSKIVQVTYNGLFLGTADELVKLLKEHFHEFGLETKDCFQEPVGNNSCTDKPCIKKVCYQVPWIQAVLFFSGKKPNQPVDILLRKITNSNAFYKATSDFLRAPIPDKGWKMIHKMFWREDRPMMILDPFGGKMDMIAEDEIPFPHRKGNLFNIQYMINWFEDNTDDVSRKHIEWIRSLRKKMTPFVAKSPRTAYINYRDLDLGKNNDCYSYKEARVWGEMYFKGNFERLARIKGEVDPGNFFRNEQSIPVLV